jgi:hypothetical protein
MKDRGIGPGVDRMQTRYLDKSVREKDLAAILSGTKVAWGKDVEGLRAERRISAALDVTKRRLRRLNKVKAH